MQDNGGELIGGLFAGGMVLVIMLLSLVSLALFIWALIDAIKNPRLSDNERLIWILVIVFVGCLGPILYLTIGRNKSGGPTAGRPPL